jgi:hypothetical protein
MDIPRQKAKSLDMMFLGWSPEPGNPVRRAHSFKRACAKFRRRSIIRENLRQPIEMHVALNAGHIATDIAQKIFQCLQAWPGDFRSLTRGSQERGITACTSGHWIGGTQSEQRNRRATLPTSIV